MKIEIKNRWTGNIIVSGEYADLTEAVVEKKANLTGANLYGADLSGVNLTGANLYGADLSGVNLTGANLTGANLYGANLTGANLYGANLTGANLTRAIGVNKYKVTSLMMLLDQPGPIRLYKLVTNNYKSPMYSKKLRYVIGEEVCETEADTNDQEQCGAGINVATLDWCMREWRVGHRILVVEFTAADIACIPIGTDGKIRLHRCKVVGEKDLTEIGLIKTEETDGTTK